MKDLSIDVDEKPDPKVGSHCGAQLAGLTLPGIIGKITSSTLQFVAGIGVLVLQAKWRNLFFRLEAAGSQADGSPGWPDPTAPLVIED